LEFRLSPVAAGSSGWHTAGAPRGQTATLCRKMWVGGYVTRRRLTGEGLTARRPGPRTRGCGDVTRPGPQGIRGGRDGGLVRRAIRLAGGQLDGEPLKSWNSNQTGSPSPCMRQPPGPTQASAAGLHPWQDGILKWWGRATGRPAAGCTRKGTMPLLGFLAFLSGSHTACAPSRDRSRASRPRCEGARRRAAGQNVPLGAHARERPCVEKM
jgi:hypothetical protein